MLLSSIKNYSEIVKLIEITVVNIIIHVVIVEDDLIRNNEIVLCIIYKDFIKGTIWYEAAVPIFLVYDMINL